MIVPSVKVFATPAFVLGALFAFAFCDATSSASAAEAEAVTIDTTFTVKTPPVRLVIPPPPARASVVLMTGGNGLLSPRFHRDHHQLDRQLSDPVGQSFLAPRPQCDDGGRLAGAPCRPRQHHTLELRARGGTPRFHQRRADPLEQTRVGDRHQQRQCLDGDGGRLSAGTFRACRRRDDLAGDRPAGGQSTHVQPLCFAYHPPGPGRLGGQ